jgi:Ca-activated chloride channel family protein
MPLTSDFAVAKLYVSNASLMQCPCRELLLVMHCSFGNNALDTKEKKYKAIVLISDGEDHDPNSTEIIQQLADNGVVVNTIGVGSVEGAPIMEPGANAYKTDVNGQTVISKLNEEELKRIAQQTGGIYLHLDNAATAANQITAALDSMEKKAIETAGSINNMRHSIVFL